MFHAVFCAFSIFSIFFGILISGLPRACTKLVETGRNLWHSFFYIHSKPMSVHFLRMHFFPSATVASFFTGVPAPAWRAPRGRSGSGFRTSRGCICGNIQARVEYTCEENHSHIYVELASGQRRAFRPGRCLLFRCWRVPAVSARRKRGRCVGLAYQQPAASG